MKWPNAVSLSKKQLSEVGRRLRAAGYNVKTKELNPFAVNIVNFCAGADPDAQKEVRSIIESVL